MVFLGGLSGPAAATGKEVETQMAELADGFDYPVGKPDASGYYKARAFRSWYHLGEDWNALGDPDSDLGNSVFSIGHGLVVYSKDYQSTWGNVVIIRHAYRHSDGKIYYIDSLYAHLQKRSVELHDRVKRGKLIGSIGNNEGMYPTHLHFEIRKNINVGLIHSRYARDFSNYHSPTAFIEAHRSLRNEFRMHPVPVDCFDRGVSNRYAGPGLEALPDLPTQQETTSPAQMNQQLRNILIKNRLLSDSDEDSTAAEPTDETETERDKIRSFWDAFRPQLREDASP